MTGFRHRFEKALAGVYPLTMISGWRGLSFRIRTNDILGYVIIIPIPNNLPWRVAGR